jgi:hypothetical protein
MVVLSFAVSRLDRTLRYTTTDNFYMLCNITVGKKSNYSDEKWSLQVCYNEMRHNLYILNCWVMHPVARVSTNTLIKTTVRNKCFSRSILLCTTTTCFGPDRWPSSGKMYTKNIFKVTTVNGSVLIKVLIDNLWPPLWSSDQSSWLQIRRPGFDSRH